MDFREYIEQNAITYQDKDLYVSSTLPVSDDNYKVPRDYEALVILFCSKGRLHVNISGNDIDMSASDVLVCHTMQSFNDIMFSADLQCAVVAMTSQYVSRLLVDEPSVINRFMQIHENPLLHIESEMEKTPHFGNIIVGKLQQQDQPYFHSSLDALMRFFLLELLRLYTIHHNLETEEEFITPNSSITKRFLWLLAKDKGYHRTVQYYADQLCITPKHLSSVCRAESGKTPSQWIQKRTMELIVNFLTASDLSIKEIAAVLDFPNISFFGKYVKQHIGISPSAYRKKIRNKEQSKEDKQ